MAARAERVEQWPLALAAAGAAATAAAGGGAAAAQHVAHRVPDEEAEEREVDAEVVAIHSHGMGSARAEAEDVRDEEQRDAAPRPAATARTT